MPPIWLYQAAQVYARKRQLIALPIAATRHAVHSTFSEGVRYSSPFAPQNVELVETNELEQCLALDKIDELISKAHALLREKNYSDARKLYKRVLSQSPKSVHALNGLGFAELSLGNRSGATRAFRNAHAITPTWELKHNLAFALLLEKNYAPARQLLDEAMASSTLPALRESQKNAEMVEDILPRLHHKNAYKQGIRDAWEHNAISDLQSQITPTDKLCAVFFYVDWLDEHPFLGKGTQALDYKQCLSVACLTAKHTQADVFVITDKKSVLNLPEWVTILRLDLDPSQMMFSRMRASRALVMTQKLTGPLLFLDVDVCLNRDFRPAFNGTFDIGLTYRTEVGFWHMPINEGVILIADGASEYSAQFFGECLNIYEWLADQPSVNNRYGFNVKMWRGGQLSLAAHIDWEPPPFAGDRRINGVRYKFFPCKEFNYAVEDGDKNAVLSQKWAVHFKGSDSKGRMMQYASPHSN